MNMYTQKILINQIRKEKNPFEIHFTFKKYVEIKLVIYNIVFFLYIMKLKKRKENLKEIQKEEEESHKRI